MPDKYCIASGSFSDSAIWSLSEDGIGGAGMPGIGENIYLNRSVTIEKFINPEAAKRSIYVASGADCSIMPSTTSSLYFVADKSLTIHGTLRLADQLNTNRYVAFRESSRLVIGENGKLVLGLPGTSLPWYLLLMGYLASIDNRGIIEGNDYDHYSIILYFGPEPMGMVSPGRIKTFDLRSSIGLAEGEEAGQTITGNVTCFRFSLRGVHAGTFFARLRSPECRMERFEYATQHDAAKLIFEQYGNLFVAGDVFQISNAGIFLWNVSDGAVSTFTGTADQEITMPLAVTGQSWISDKPAGILRLANFDGFLQGRLRELVVDAGSAIDLSGPSPCLLNSTNEAVLFPGLKADVCPTDGPTLSDDAVHEFEAMDSCVNEGRITIPEGKVLCTRIMDNRAGASISGNGILRVEYGGLSNAGTITDDISIRYFNRPRMIELAVAPSSGYPPLTVTAEATDEFGGLRTFAWGNGHITGPVETASATYTYREPGLYTVTVKDVDPDGVERSTSRPVTVLSPPLPLAEMVISPKQGNVPLEVELSTEGSEGNSMAIDWGDGSPLYGPVTGITASVSHCYETPGRFPVKLQVWNATEALAEASQVVRVQDSEGLYAALDILPSTGEVPLTVLADASESEGDEFLFIWGDGTSDGPQTVSHATHTFRRAGYYSVVLTTTKADHSVSATQGVTVLSALQPTPVTLVPSLLGPVELEERERPHGLPRGHMPSLYRYTLAQGNCYMNDTIRLFCPMTRGGRALHNGSALFLGRITHADGSAIAPEEIGSACCTIYRLDESDPTVRTAVEGHTEVPLEVEDILLSGPVTDENWPFDETGYNFRHVLDDTTHSPFPVPGRHYLVVFTLSPLDASPKLRLEYRVHVL